MTPKQVWHEFTENIFLSTETIMIWNKKNATVDATVTAELEKIKIQHPDIKDSFKYIKPIPGAKSARMQNCNFCDPPENCPLCP